MPPSQINRPFQPYPAQPGQPTAGPQKSHGLGLALLLILFIVLFLGALGFGLWAYTERQEYKDKSDQKAAKAVALAVQQESTKKDNEFAEKEKNPLKSYQAPEAYGSLLITYPKTWGAYVVETDRGATPVDGYFHPNYVPGVQTQTAFALRIQITGQAYDTEMKTFEAKVKQGTIKVTPFTPKNVPGVTGARLDGEIGQNKQGSLILLPLRDKTIKISTEAQQFLGDFNNNIVPSIKFVP